MNSLHIQLPVTIGPSQHLAGVIVFAAVCQQLRHGELALTNFYTHTSLRKCARVHVYVRVRACARARACVRACACCIVCRDHLQAEEHHENVRSSHSQTRRAV